MKTLFFCLVISIICLFITSTAQHKYVERDYGPGNSFEAATKKEDDSRLKPHIAPILIKVARAAKFIYTKDPKFEFEKETELETQKDTASHEYQ